MGTAPYAAPSAVAAVVTQHGPAESALPSAVAADLVDMRPAPSAVEAQHLAPARPGQHPIHQLHAAAP
jgi:hypothetical protein